MKPQAQTEWSVESQVALMQVLEARYEDNMEGCDCDEFDYWEKLATAAHTILVAMQGGMVSQVTVTINEPQKRKARVSHDAAGSLAIYELYPRKIARPAALRAIAKAVAKFGFDAVRKKTEAYAAARVGEDPNFTPHPATWFNQERFNDEPETWKNGGGHRNGNGASESMRLMVATKKLERAEAEIKRIRDSVECHQSLSNEEREALRRAKAERDAAKQELGLKI